MTKAELLEEVLQGVLLIVGNYRGSHAEEAGYVHRKFGNKIVYIRGIHLAECSWHGHVGPVLITERFPEQVATVEQAASTFTYTKGKLYVFYIDRFKRERGQTFASLNSWGIEEIEGSEEAPAAPQAG